MVEETTRKQHVWRQAQEEDEDVWLDLLRVDQLVTIKGQKNTFQKTTYNIKWDDEANPTEHPTRTLRVEEVKNPEDEEQIIEVHSISKMQTFQGDQKKTFKFLGGEVVTQKVQYRRVRHMDAEVPDKKIAFEDYARDEASLDESQYKDVRVIDQMVTITQGGQIEIFKFDNKRLYEFSVPTPEEEPDLAKVAFLDPLQNIINVQWGGHTMFVAPSRILRWNDPFGSLFINRGTFIQMANRGGPWSQTMDEATHFDVDAICYSDKMDKFFVGIGIGDGPDKFFVSSDGLKWTRESIPGAESFGVTILEYDRYTKTAYAVLGSFIYYANAGDGAGWKRLGTSIEFDKGMLSGADNSRPLKVTTGQASTTVHVRLVARRLAQAAIEISIGDRKSFAPVTLPGDGKPTGVAVGKGTIVVTMWDFSQFPNLGYIVVSKNGGLSWQTVGPSAYAYKGAGFASNKFAVCGHDGSSHFILESDDGLSWRTAYSISRGGDTYPETGEFSCMTTGR